MAKINKRTNELEDYIRQVEAKEKGKKKKMTVIAFAVVGILGLGSIPIYMQTQRASLRKFTANELSIYAVDSIFEADTARIVIDNGRGVKADTITSVDEYIELKLPATDTELGAVFDDSAIEADSLSAESEAAENTIPVSSSDNSEPKTKLPKFFFAIEGSKIVGEKVNITIVDYDENINYTIDFGNGIKRRIRKRLSYAYPKTGNFLINLIATNSTNASSIYTRSISIRNKPAKKETKKAEPKANTQIAEQTKPKEDQTKNNPIDENLTAANGQEADNLFAEIIENSNSSKVEGSNNQANNSTKEAEKAEKAEDLKPKITGPLIHAEKMPSFPGGEVAMYKFLNRKIRYPRLARESATEGRVYLQFVVNPDGSISNIKVLRGIGYGCDEEAKRVVGLMPNWISGEQGGQKVPVYQTVRISFKLQ